VLMIGFLMIIQIMENAKNHMLLQLAAGLGFGLVLAFTSHVVVDEIRQTQENSSPAQRGFNMQ